MAPEGFYVAPHVSFSNVTVSDKRALNSGVFIQITHLNVNMMGGYQILSKYLAYDFFFGLGYKQNTWFEVTPKYINNITPTENEFRLYTNNFKINLGLNVGFGL